eukprot:SAG22_NODE_3879_length_1485_cov_3.041847_2_plen_78_part_00
MILGATGMACTLGLHSQCADEPGLCDAMTDCRRKDAELSSAHLPSCPRHLMQSPPRTGGSLRSSCPPGGSVSAGQSD